MKGAVLYGPRDVRVEEVPEPVLGDDEVLVQSITVGICPTDVAGYLAPGQTPMVIGHEFAGVVVALGKQVAGLGVGDRVFGEPAWGCGFCAMCRKGMAAFCSQHRLLGGNAGGAFAHYFKIGPQALYRIPEGVSDEAAQSLLIVACALRGVQRGGVSVGSRVAILGPGHGGLLLLQLCRLAGAETIVVTGTREHRLKLARQLGADVTVNVKQEGGIPRLKDVGGDRGFDVVIDAAGTPAAMRQAMEIVADGGRIVIFSVHRQPVDGLLLKDMVHKELSIVGTRGGPYDDAARLVQENKVQVLPLVSHYLPLDRTREGLEMMVNRTEGALRIVIRPQE
ncbi:MAG: zinc-binding dehydrogenase [Chloroflexi bacterium]|nr:zinc-binding dehydrogenase [Chloroflexota bacterium]